MHFFNAITFTKETFLKLKPHTMADWMPLFVLKFHVYVLHQYHHHNHHCHIKVIQKMILHMWVSFEGIHLLIAYTSDLQTFLHVAMWKSMQIILWLLYIHKQFESLKISVMPKFWQPNFMEFYIDYTLANRKYPLPGNFQRTWTFSGNLIMVTGMTAWAQVLELPLGTWSTPGMS